MAQRLLLLWFSFCLLFTSSFAANAALRKSITAEHSCGVNKTEIYYPISEEDLPPYKRNYSECNQNDSSLAHPPEAMVDGDDTTFWQSTSSKDKARIRIDLSGPYQKYYYVKNIIIHFGDYYRPKRMAFYKKSSIKETWKPWHYIVTNFKNCKDEFNATYQEVPSAPDSLLCTEYKLAAIKAGEVVEMQFQGGRGIVHDGNGIVNTKLLDFMKTTVVEIRFSGLHLKFDHLARLWQHYVVQEIEITGYCDCNGQADGLNCRYNDTLKDMQCVCQEGACGVQCDRCCPEYNQYPYKKGSMGPFIVDRNAACTKCNCHNHSAVCIYNETIAKNSECSYVNITATNDDCSLNISGRYRGGGVCVGCEDNTEGTNCQRCSTGFYRPIGKDQGDKDACHSCECFPNGTKNTTKNGVLYLDCVRDEEEAGKLIGLEPGDCLCKNKTTGRQCDRCIDGYYNLTGDNPEGCLACECNTIGTRNGSIICNDTGVCFCKENVQGIKCTECRSGTFNLADANQYGCTKCSCSGITTNCTSTKLYKNELHHNISEWKLVRGEFDNYVVLPFMIIKDEVNGALVDMISFNISTENDLFWMADNNSFGKDSLVSSYGGYLSFSQKVSSLPNRTLESNQTIVLKGPRDIFIKQLLPPLVPGLQNPVTSSVKMVEFNWNVYKSGAPVDRNTFMLVLAKLQGIWISASHYDIGDGIYQTSFGNVRLSSVSSHSNDNKTAVDVEHCSCSKEYTGLSCERCARGHHRQNTTGHSFFGVCVRCNCHGHTQDCDPDTGRCLGCQHDTTGFTCELCRDGFFGVATNGTSSDCQKCPCESPRTTSDLCSRLPNGSAQCSNCAQGYEKNRLCNRCDWGYYGRPDLRGGNCSLCQCNNNSDICDRETGSCLGYCQNNATGWYCERCENGTYGNATKQQCRACTCNETGSNNNVCNHVSGECSCKDNVEGFNCSSCVGNTFDFSDTGCTQCNCSSFGATSLQCNNSGICKCRNFTHGDKCDACDDYYFGLPYATCQGCACNATGSNHTICDHVTGQCPCKFGVDGRQCDICKVQYKRFSDNGCEPCPACTMKLQSRIDEANMTLLDLKERMEQANSSLKLDAQLQELQNNIIRVQDVQRKYSYGDEIIESYRQMHPNNSLNSTIMHIENENGKLKEKARQLETEMSDEIKRIESIFRNTESSYNYARSVNQTTDKIINSLEYMKNDLAAKNDSSLTVVLQFKNALSDGTLLEERLKHARPLVDQSIINTTDAVNLVSNQTDEINQIDNTLNNYNNTLNDIRTNMENEVKDLNEMHTKITDVKEMLDNVNNTLIKTDEILKKSLPHVNKNNQFIIEGKENYQHAQENLTMLNLQLLELESDVSDVSRSIINASSLVINASQHVKLLKAEAEALQRNYSSAKRHGESAVQSIKQYKELTKSINSSLRLSKEANTSVHEVINRIKSLTNSTDNLNRKVLKSLNGSSTLLAETKERNLNISGLSSSVYQTYELFIQANRTCRNVAMAYNVFDGVIDELTRTSTTLFPEIVSINQNTTMTAFKAQNLSDIVEKELTTLKNNVTKINKTHSTFATLLSNTITLIENTNETANQMDLVLSNITQNVNQSFDVLRETNQTQTDLTARMKSLELKLKAAKEKVAKFRLAMQLKSNTSVELRPTPRCISNPFLNEISLDFKTNLSSGLLFHMAPNKNQSISIRLVGDFVRFTYNLGDYLMVITNWAVPIDDNIWYRVYATRYRDRSRLTVIQLSSGYFRTYEGEHRFYRNLEMECRENGSVFIGGVPVGQKVNFTERDFSGVLDNFVLNQEDIPLWEPVAVQGVRRFAAKRPIKPETYDKCVTFHGNGFIRHLAGNYFKTRSNSTLQFQFRTFFKNAVLVIVEGENEQLVYNVSLSNGQVIFHYSNITLASVQSNYADGNWYNVAITRTLKNSSLHIISLTSGVPPGGPDQVAHQTRLPIYLQDARYVYFGGTNETGNRFAGGMKYVYLSSILTGNETLRDLNDTTFAPVFKGVKFDKCLQDVTEGLAYSNGYTALKSNHIGNIQSLSIRFKTDEPSGLLAYSRKEGVHFYLALFHGNIFLIYHNRSTTLRVQTDTETLNDKAYHTVEVNLKKLSVEIKVDTAHSGENHVRDLPSDLPSPVPLDNVFYIAGIEESIEIPFDVPVLRSFKGDINNVNINNNRILDGSSPTPFDAGTSIHVSAAGVSPPPRQLPPTVAPTEPPKCAGKYPAKVFSEKQEEVHFPGIDSYISLKLNQTLLDKMAASFVIGLKMRALSPNGVLFLAVDNVSNPTQFVSLELVDGHMIYQFNTGAGLIKMRTTANYAIGGLWYTITLLRIEQFGAIVVLENKEYNNNRGAENKQRLNLTHIFVGGVHHHVNTSMLKNPSAPSFFGCIGQLSIETYLQKEDVDLMGDSVENRTSDIEAGKCYSHVQPQIGFDGTNYAKLDGSYNLSSGSNLSIRFRTSERSGLLFYVKDKNNNNRMVLEKTNGQIVLSYYLDTKHTSVRWIDPDIEPLENSNSSFAICDNKYHTITVNRTFSYVKLMVNNKNAVYGNVTDHEIKGSVYVGGVPSGINVKIGSTGKLLVGCVENVIINGEMVDFKHDLSSSDAQIVDFGCPAPVNTKRTYSDFNPLQVVKLI